MKRLSQGHQKVSVGTRNIAQMMLLLQASAHTRQSLLNCTASSRTCTLPFPDAAGLSPSPFTCSSRCFAPISFNLKGEHKASLRRLSPSQTPHCCSADTQAAYSFSIILSHARDICLYFKGSEIHGPKTLVCLV